MQLRSEAGVWFCEFGDDFIDKYVEQHETDSAWNNTQRYLMVQTLVHFVDAYTEAFMKAGFPGDAVWTFEQLYKVNSYIQQHGTEGNYSAIKQLEAPLLEFRIQLSDPKQPSKPVRPSIINFIAKPHQLILEWYRELGLVAINKMGYYFTEQQHKEMHMLVGDLLQLAINSIKQTDVYKQAVVAGTLHNKLTAHLTNPLVSIAVEAKLNSPNTAQPLRSPSQHASSPSLLSDSQELGSPVSSSLSASSSNNSAGRKRLREEDAEEGAGKRSLSSSNSSPGNRSDEALPPSRGLPLRQQFFGEQNRDEDTASSVDNDTSSGAPSCESSAALK